MVNSERKQNRVNSSRKWWHVWGDKSVAMIWEAWRARRSLLRSHYIYLLPCIMNIAYRDPCEIKEILTNWNSIFEAIYGNSCVLYLHYIFKYVGNKKNKLRRKIFSIHWRGKIFHGSVHGSVRLKRKSDMIFVAQQFSKSIKCFFFFFI